MQQQQQHRPSGGHHSPGIVRKQSVMDAAEQHFDKNTIILLVNVMILCVLVGILYMVATSAMNVSGASKYASSHKSEH